MGDMDYWQGVGKESRSSKPFLAMPMVMKAKISETDDDASLYIICSFICEKSTDTE
jgi:hypothetical protein